MEKFWMDRMGWGSTASSNATARKGPPKGLRQSDSMALESALPLGELERGPSLRSCRPAAAAARTADGMLAAAGRETRDRKSVV